MKLGKQDFKWSWKECTFGFVILWKRDVLFVFLFLIVNILIGQIGVLTSLSVASEAGGQLLRAWNANLDAAALYTFAISLLAGSLAMVVTEVVDAFRYQNSIKGFEYKFFWSLIAAALLVLQSPLAGNVIANSSGPLLDQVATAVKVSQPVLTQPIIPTSDTSSTPPPAEVKPVVTSSTDKQGHASVFQTVYWILSMLVAFQLFCLVRNSAIPDHYAADHTQVVNEKAGRGESKDQTSFGESL